MPDSKGPESRWSSVREREERDRQRREARERAKQGLPDPKTDASKLSDDERSTIRRSRFSDPPSKKTPKSGTPEAAQAPPETPPASAGSSGVGTRWRDSVAPPSGPPPSLPNLPGDDGKGRNRPPNSRLIMFGLILFVVMALVAFLPFSPLTQDDDKATPTPIATLPSILDTPEPGSEDDVAIHESTPETGQAVVCIDAGHGGWDTGWNRSDQEVETNMGPYTLPFVTEANINLGMSYMLKEELEAMGFFVVLTRPSGAAVNMFDDDVNEDGQTWSNQSDPDIRESARARDEFQARINVCNEADADILVSVHVNGFQTSGDDWQGVRGYEILYTAERDFGDKNEALANSIYRQLDSALRDTEMGGTGNGVERDSDVERTHEFGTAPNYIMTGPAWEQGSIEPSNMPGVILECVFLSNDTDAQFIAQPENQRLFAHAYALGIQDYFERNPAS